MEAVCPALGKKLPLLNTGLHGPWMRTAKPWLNAMLSTRLLCHHTWRRAREPILCRSLNPGSLISHVAWRGRQGLIDESLLSLFPHWPIASQHAHRLRIAARTHSIKMQCDQFAARSLAPSWFLVCTSVHGSSRRPQSNPILNLYPPFPSPSSLIRRCGRCSRQIAEHSNRWIPQRRYRPVQAAAMPGSP